MKNTFVKVLSFMMALTMIVGAFGAITVSAADCAHEDRTEIAVVAPTCDTIGFTKYTCNDCGEEFADNVKAATGKHDYKDVPKTGATCDEPAYKAYKACSVCGKEDPNNRKTVDTSVNGGNSLGHLWTKTYVQAATCTVDGFTAPQCARCDKVDETKKSNITTAEHDYIYTVVTAPTACTAGSVQVTCSACDYNELIGKDDAKHNPVDMPATSADPKVPLAGEGCQYKYKSGKYCSECYVIISSVANNVNKHDAVAANTVDGYTGGKITSANLTAELANLGYKVGDDFNLKATCTTPGYDLLFCNTCKKFIKTQTLVNEGKGHKWVKDGAEYYADPAKNTHAYDKLQDYKCDNVDCDETKTEIAKAATPHDYTGKYTDTADGNKEKDCVNVVAATCENNGYTRHTCKLCLESYDDAVTYKTGHNYGAPVYKSGTCEPGDDTADAKNVLVYVQKCPNKGCETPEKAVAVPEGKDKCTWVKVERKGTCVKEAYYEYECSVCKNTKEYGLAANETDKPTAGKDPANHVAKWNATAGKAENVNTAIGTDGLLEANIVKQTCTTSQVDRYMCQCNVAVDLTVGAAPKHTEVEGGTYHKHAVGSDDCTADCKSVAVKAATCKAEGIKTAGKICTVCGVITKAPVVAPIDATKHDTVNYGAAVPVESAAATCVAKAYTKMYYPCCQKVDKIESGNVVETAHGAKLKTVAAVAATCTSKGVAAHKKCDACGLLWKADQANLTKANAVTLASLATATADGDLVHDWNTTAVPEAPETCTTAGTKAYYTCKDCTTHIKVDGQIVCDDPATTDKNERDEALKIAAHGTKYMGRYAYLNSENGPTCTEGAWANITNDYICKKCVLEADKATAEANKADGIYWELPLNHKNSTPDPINATGSAKYDCTKPTYVVNYCVDCDYVWVSAYTPATNAKHDFDRNNDEKVDDKDYVDSLCKPADCTNAGVNVFKCENCTVTEEVAGAAATGHFLNTAGGKVAISFSCKDDAYVEYIGVACSGCGESVHYETIDGQKVLVGVVHKHVTSVKEATCTEDGFEIEYCSDCNEIFASTTEEKLGHEYNPGAPIEIVDGVAKYSCPVCGEYWTEEILEVVVDAEFSSTLLTAGATFTVDIFVTADNFTFNYFEIDCYDDDDACKLVKVELTDALPATAHADFAEDGWFWIYSEHDVNGDPAFITLDGEKVKVATLTYEVSDIAYGPATFEVGPYAAVVGFDEEGNAIEANFVNTYTYVDVVVAMAGDLNGDGGIGYSDVQAVMFAVANGANDLVADVNRDGVVDVFDIAALRKFTSSDNSAYDFFVMTGVDVEAVAAKYKADMNEDGYINDSDKVLFVEFIVDLLQDEYYQDVLEDMALAGLADLDELCAEIAIEIANYGVPSL